MIFCNTISLQSNSHGFPSSGGGGDSSPPPTAKHMLITSHLKIFSIYQRFLLPQLNDSFHKSFIKKHPKSYIFVCSNCSYTIFLSFSFILFVCTVVHANLDFNSRSIIQKVVYTVAWKMVKMVKITPPQVPTTQ